MSEYVYRIHPTIGIARVGNSPDFYLGPETPAGLPLEGGNGETTGGLPIRPGTEDETITSSDLRDANGALKRQAARFRIFQYPKTAREHYPTGQGAEVKIGSTVSGKRVEDIVWTVHPANKKTSFYESDDDHGVEGYVNKGAPPLGNAPPLRNLDEGLDPDDRARLRKLIIDPGPRAIKGTDSKGVKFDRDTTASYRGSGAKIEQQPHYPKSFPSDGFPELHCPAGPIDTLGELQTDGDGRLLVLSGFGRAVGWHQSLCADVNNDAWFDDVADGPVSAALVFDDGTVEEVLGGAWVVTTDPGYAPQTLNAVTLWDDILDSWVRKLALCPDLFNGGFSSTYRPSFDDDVYPIFRSASLQRWNTNLNKVGMAAHEAVDGNTIDPGGTLLDGLGFIRDPSNEEQLSDGRLMPLSLGDAGKSFLTLTLTQYFFLQRWAAKECSDGPGPKLGPGEYLDKVILVNCLGGRFSPGIDMTYICREPDLYIENWQTSGTGPFRIHPKPLNYEAAKSGEPFLTLGYVPRRKAGTPGSGTLGLEPGDISKFMAIPWHTDYNSCATHLPAPNPPQNNTLYWSWPAQRPVSIYRVKDLKDGRPVIQRFSVRGQGTSTKDPAEVGRYHERLEIVKNWQRIGIVIQGSAIDTEGGPYSAEYYLEIASQFEEDGDEVKPWPNKVAPGTGT
jgi:hypothetical protein